MKIRNFATKFWYANIIEIIACDGMVGEIKDDDSVEVPQLVKISPKWFARRFPRPSTTPESDRKNWSRYRSGETIPRVRLGFHPVKAVAKVYPTTGRYFLTPVWEILGGKEMDKREIEKALSLLGTRVTGERHGLVGKILFDQKFWKQDADIETVQAARYSILKDVEPFELMETLVLMLAWADAGKNSDLKDEICEFYYYVIPEIVWADDIRLRFELLDIVEKYAIKREKTPYRKDIEIRYRWRTQTTQLELSLANRYFDLMHSHLLFWQKKELDPVRLWWANLVAKVVMKESMLWDKYSEISWFLVDVFFRMAAEGQIVIHKRKKIWLFGFLNKDTRGASRLIIKHPTDTKKLEAKLLKEIKGFIKNPDSHEFQFEQKMSG